MRIHLFIIGCHFGWSVCANRDFCRDDDEVVLLQPLVTSRSGVSRAEQNRQDFNDIVHSQVGLLDNLLLCRHGNCRSSRPVNSAVGSVQTAGVDATLKTDNAGIGFFLLLLAASAGGLYTTPMTLVKTNWSFEASWFLYSCLGLIVFPWITGLLTCPGLLHALGSLDGEKVLLTALFGFLWGIGCQLFGIGISIVGNSLGFALILGLAATLGSAIPLVALHPGEVASKAGILNFVGLGLAVVALVATAYAGIVKERDAKTAVSLLAADNKAAGTKQTLPECAGSLSKGIVVSVLSGVFSACLNLATSFGHDIAEAAVKHGAAKSMGTNAIYCVSVTAGSIPNLAYCGYIMAKKDGFPFVHGKAMLLKNVLVTMAMGVLWYGSNVLYGVATTLLPGDLGTVVGWPIYIIGMVLFANVSGIVQGEWRGAGIKAKLWMGTGILILCTAIVVVGLAGA